MILLPWQVLREQVPVDSMEWLQKVAEGNVPGYSSIEKFGEVPEVTTQTDPADVWDGGGIYNFSSSADIDRISSSDNGDTQLLLIYGLDENLFTVVQAKALTGQAPVALDTPLMRVYRIININSVNMAGDVYCFVNGAVTGGIPDDASTIRAMIRTPFNQTLMAIYTIPCDKTGYLYNGYAMISKSGGVAAATQFSAYAGPVGGVMAVKARASCNSAGNSSWNRNYLIPPALPQCTDILIRCEEVSATVGVSAGFTVLLRDAPVVTP